MKTPNLRLLAARIINDVTDGRSLSDCLEPTLKTLKDSRDRALVQAICYGVCRYYTRLDVMLSYLLKKPMNAEDSDVHALLLVGLYQLMDMRVAQHAAVSETVNAVEKMKKPWARGFVNAVLREYLRNHEALEERLQEDEEAHYAHPDWWIQTIKKAWPEQWEAILAANNAHPPFSLRVNQRIQKRDDYLEKVVGHAIAETQSGIVLDTPMPAEDLPGFYQGEVSVQDGAAQLAAELLDLKPNLRVLDACSAPGGKLTHILEIEPNLAACVAVEVDPERTKSIKENLARLRLQATCLTADASDVSAWWDGQQFDRILVDAPCSASGVIRRHPDIKLLRELNDLKGLVKEQRELLDALWPTLSADGVLLYATCSVFPQENVETVKAFLASHPDAHEDKIDAAWGVACEVGRQILPGMHGMDGFYYALIKKHSG